jgi:sugar lactone lactonase YvrE
MSLFRCLFGGLAALGAVLASAAVVATIVVPGERAYPESLSASVDGTLYIGRAGDGGVVRRRPGHRPEIWIAPGAFGTRSILGVLVDEPSGTLWVCSDDLTSAGIASPGAGKTGLKGFDLQTGRGKVSADVPGEDTFCSDVTVASDGTVYISDGSGRILRLNSDARTFAILVTDPRLEDVDGIAFGEDGNLYVNTYGNGELFRVGVKGGDVGKLTKLNTPRPLTHPDGMRTLTGNTFLMVEAVGRLDLIKVRGDTVLISALKEGLLEPAAMTSVGHTVWVAEAQMSVLFDPKHAHRPLLPFQIVAVPLDGR